MAYHPANLLSKEIWLTANARCPPVCPSPYNCPILKPDILLSISYISHMFLRWSLQLQGCVQKDGVLSPTSTQGLEKKDVKSLLSYHRSPCWHEKGLLSQSCHLSGLSRQGCGFSRPSQRCGNRWVRRHQNLQRIRKAALQLSKTSTDADILSLHFACNFWGHLVLTSKA